VKKKLRVRAVTHRRLARIARAQVRRAARRVSRLGAEPASRRAYSTARQDKSKRVSTQKSVASAASSRAAKSMRHSPCASRHRFSSRVAGNARAAAPRARRAI